MKSTLVVLGAAISLTATLTAVGGPVSAGENGARGDTVRAIVPQAFDIGPGNTWTPELRAAMDSALNPPIYVSNLSGRDYLSDLPADVASYVAALAEVAGKQGYNTVTCSYATANWFNGYTSGNADWYAGPMLDAYVRGNDTALGVGYDAKTSSATSEVGIWLTMSGNWPTPSNVTVDYRWGGGAYLQADADLSVLAGTGSSSASAAYAIDGELWANSVRASQHFYTAAVHANGLHPSSTSNPHVRWDDNTSAAPPTLKMALAPNMDVISKTIGSMTDTAEPVPGANASAGVDSWNRGDTYIVGSQHFTFQIPKGYTIGDCGGDGVLS